ncbi:MAG: hypothetical protein EBR82_27450 [Caulobacteraceae bacterium]|nr:hypothetical protein [Caulobacteraceae bacterium]
MPGSRRPRQPGHRTRRLLIRGQVWRLCEFAGDAPPGEKGRLHGLCDYVRRIIWVSACHRSQLDRLDTLVHEVLHAALPDLDETAVGEVANAIAVAIAADLTRPTGEGHHRQG